MCEDRRNTKTIGIATSITAQPAMANVVRQPTAPINRCAAGGMTIDPSSRAAKERSSRNGRNTPRYLAKATATAASDRRWDGYGWHVAGAM